MYLKSLIVYKSNLKIKVTLPRTFFSILLMSEVIYKQRLLNENEIVQFLQNCKCYDVDQSHFRKPWKSSAKNIRNKCPKSTRSFFTDRSIFDYFTRLNCYDFRITLTKLVKLYFLILHFQALFHIEEVKFFKKGQLRGSLKQLNLEQDSGHNTG